MNIHQQNNLFPPKPMESVELTTRMLNNSAGVQGHFNSPGYHGQ